MGHPRPYTKFSSKGHMDNETFDLWEEIRDMPGEIFDIPEMQESVLDFEESLKSKEDF